MVSGPEFPSLPAEAVLAFVRQASIEPTFDDKYVARSLNLSTMEARQIIPVLLAMGYVEPAGRNRYRTTESGDTAAGAKPPRLRRENVEKALAGLLDRIRAGNDVDRAVVFGQYLTAHDVIQGVDAGIELTTTDRRQRQDLLKKLRARSPALMLHEFAPWMERIRHEVIWPPPAKRSR